MPIEERMPAAFIESGKYFTFVQNQRESFDSFEKAGKVPKITKIAVKGYQKEKIKTMNNATEK